MQCVKKKNVIIIWAKRVKSEMKQLRKQQQMSVKVMKGAKCLEKIHTGCALYLSKTTTTTTNFSYN